MFDIRAMALIEGSGDKVIQFFGILFVVVLIVLLWMSTQVAEMQLFRGSVFILERRHHDATRATPLVPNQSMSEQSTTETVPLNDVIQTNSTLSNDNPENKNDNPIATKSDVTEQTDESSQSNDTDDIENEPQIYEDSIRIRLKYINDNSRLVQGRLQETIGVFKRRHFTNELTSNKIIRLIFQGKVLHDDEASLSSCDLHDNCVVHCLIHQPRPTPNAQQTSDPVHYDISEQPLPNMIRHNQHQPRLVQREWNLATLLSALITIIVSLLWYARFQFDTLFSYTSTGTLGIMTVIFLFTAFLTFFMENEEQQHNLPQTRHN